MQTSGVSPQPAPGWLPNVASPLFHALLAASATPSLSSGPNGYQGGHRGRILNIKYLPSDSMLPPLRLAMRLKFFRDPVMPSRDSGSGDIEPPPQDDAGFSRHFPAKVNRHIPG
jgi:hypothetical protein